MAIRNRGDEVEQAQIEKCQIDMIPRSIILRVQIWRAGHFYSSDYYFFVCTVASYLSWTDYWKFSNTEGKYAEQLFLERNNSPTSCLRPAQNTNSGKW